MADTNTARPEHADLSRYAADMADWGQDYADHALCCALQEAGLDLAGWLRHRRCSGGARVLPRLSRRARMEIWRNIERSGGVDGWRAAAYQSHMIALDLRAA